MGVFGSGQLGRMLALAARAMGYRIATFSPDTDSPTGQIADREISAPYDDLAAVRSFVRGVDVVTFEFENVAAAVAAIAEEEGVPVRPGGHVLHTAQNRLREKHFLAQHQLPVTPFRAVRSLAELEDAFGVEDLQALVARLSSGRFAARDLVRIIGAGLRGAGHDIADSDVAAMAAEDGVAGQARLAMSLLAAAFGTPETAGNPARP